MISTMLRILLGTTARTCGASEAAESSMVGSRRADAKCLAQMSSQFFDKLNATQLFKDRFLNYVQATFKQETCANDRATAEKRKVNSHLFKDMTTSFMTEFKIGLRKETSLHEKAPASQEMQLERQKDLKIYQAQAMEINEQLRAFQNCASANNTLSLNFSPGDPCMTPTTPKTLPQW
jgi:ribosomal protein L16 Arg81 hydroxylase